MAVRGNLSRFGDVVEWWGVVEGRVEPVIEDPAFLEQALSSAAACALGARNLGGLDRSPESIERAEGQGAVPSAAGWPLTGRETGPDLKHLLPLIGRATASARLAGTAA